MGPSEVEQLAASGLVEDAVEFVPNPLVYMVHSSKDAKQLEITFLNGWVTVTLPADQARKWVTSDEVGIEGIFRGISVLVEKDWPCVHSNAGDNDDTFPRPA
jgi:hypothetical protein